MGGRSSSFRAGGGGGMIKMSDNDTLNDLMNRITPKRQAAINGILPQRLHSYYVRNNKEELQNSMDKTGKFYDDSEKLSQISDYVMNFGRKHGFNATISSIRNSNSIPDRLNLDRMTKTINEYNEKHRRR